MKRNELKYQQLTNLKHYSFSESESEMSVYDSPTKDRKVFRLYQQNTDSRQSNHYAPKSSRLNEHISQTVFNKMNTMSGYIPPKLTDISTLDIPRNPNKITKSIFSHPPNFERKTDFQPPSKIRNTPPVRTTNTVKVNKYFNPIARLQQQNSPSPIKTQQNYNDQLIKIVPFIQYPQIITSRIEQQSINNYNYQDNQKITCVLANNFHTFNQSFDQQIQQTFIVQQEPLRLGTSSQIGLVKYFNDRIKLQQRHKLCKYCNEYVLIQDTKRHQFQCKFSNDDQLEIIQGNQGSINQISNLLPAKQYNKQVNNQEWINRKSSSEQQKQQNIDSPKQLINSKISYEYVDYQSIQRQRIQDINRNFQDFSNRTPSFQNIRIKISEVQSAFGK